MCLMVTLPGFLLELVAAPAVVLLPVRLGPLHGAPRLLRRRRRLGGAVVGAAAVGDDAAVAAEDDDGRRLSLRLQLRSLLLIGGVLTAAVDLDLRAQICTLVGVAFGIKDAV